METLFLTDSPIFTWVILPLLIFFARILDVSIGTLRLIFVSKGYKFYAPLLGFFEVVIWLLAIGQIMQHLDNFMCYFAYGLGFATGNYLGIILEEKMSLGTVLIRVVPKMDTTNLINHLREHNFGASLVDIEGMTGKLKMIFTIVKRKDLKEVMGIIHEYNPQAFVTIEDVKTAREGYFRFSRKRNLAPVGLFQDFRKGK
jgi:uncharacterized protein YebE (UPF0316 family)